MDANSAVNAFVSHANQYSLSQNDDSIKHFQRHLEILVCLTTEESNLDFFRHQTLLSSQCVTHVVNVLLDSGARLPLLTRALTILQNLSANASLLKSLQTTFYVHSAVSIFLQRYGSNAKDNVVLQCLQLLESVTYNIKIDYIENHFEHLIETLLNFVTSESSNVLKSSLHILSNICRHNYKVQVHICNLPNIKHIFKKLAFIINSEAPNIILYALSILSSISPYHNLGTKLWTDEHLMLTFELIMKLMISDSHNCASTAVDLFADMIKVTKYQSCLIKSPSLLRCVRKISKGLYQSTSKRSLLYLKFLHSLTVIPEITEHLCSILCIVQSTDQGQSSQSLKIHPKLVLWCSEKEEIPATVTITSLQLVKNVLTFHNEKGIYNIEDTAKDVLEKILENICIWQPSNDNNKEVCLAVKQAEFDLLSYLCESMSMKKYISQALNIHECGNLIKIILSDASENSKCYDQTVDIFLLIAETISLLSDTLKDYDEFLGNLLIDDNAMHCVAFALTSDNKDRINKSLLLLSKNNYKCSLNTLSDSLLMKNSQRFSSQKSDTGFFSQSNLSVPNGVKTKCSESSIDTLMSKVENGLQIKDLKSSEIMDLYEHKIAILTVKEQELQSYVDAKTSALQEADRIITQYKCRQADTDAEALRLRSMLKDFECRSEMSAARLSCEEQKRRRLESDLSLAYHKIKELEQNMTEQKELSETQFNRLAEQKKNIEEEKLRLMELIAAKEQEKKMLINQLQQNEEELRGRNKFIEELQESKEDLRNILEEAKKSAEKMKLNFEQKQLQLQNTIDAAQQSISSLEEKNEAVVNEMAKKTEEFSHQIADLLRERDQLVEQLKLKDSKIEDLADCLRKENISIQEKDCIIRENETLLSNLKVTLEQIEAQKMKLKKDKEMLELLCKKYEASIEERDAKLQKISQEKEKLEVLCKKYEVSTEEKDSKIKKISFELTELRKEFEKSVTERDNQIQFLKDELDKHKYITEMIHNMTSGKGMPK